MAPKRAATTDKASAAKRQSKGQKQDSTKNAWCQPAIVLLRHLAPEMPASAVSMLMDAVPRALSIEIDTRHQYENEVVGMVARVCERALNSRREEVVSADACVQEHINNGLKALKELEASVAEAAVRTEAKNLAESNRLAAEEALKAAEDNVIEQKMKKTNFEADVERLLSEQATFQIEVDSFFKPLRDGVDVSKDFRARAKIANKAEAMLATAGCCPSLSSAVGLALRQPVERREKFALAALQHADLEIELRKEAISKSIADARLAAEGQATHIEAAERQVVVATEASNHALEVAINAENAWAEAESKVGGDKQIVDSQESEVSVLRANVLGAEDEVAKLFEMVTAFKTFSEKKSVPPVDENTTEVMDVQTLIVEAPVVSVN